MIGIYLGGFFQRLTTRAKQDPSGHALLFDVVRKEMIAGEHHDSRSATKGLLWLKRYVRPAVAVNVSFQYDFFSDKKHLEAPVILSLWMRASMVPNRVKCTAA